MKFGKEFRIHLEETLPEWRDKYLRYKHLKKLLKNIPTTADSIPPDHQQRPVDDHVAGAVPSLAALQHWFITVLTHELDKFNDFYVDKEEDFVIRFQALKERIERVKERSCKNGVLSAACEFSGEMMDIRKDSVTIHGEMVLLKNYSSLNFAGLVKIVKKYDKRTGGLLQFPFANLALHQPFFTTEPLTRLVCECEANLEILFPLEAEVIESVTTATHKVDTTSTAPVSNFSETPLPLGGGTVDIYRSTLSAIRTIQGLKTSSTSNPLSFASVFGSQDNGNDGAVTAENSAASDSSASLHNGAESNQDDGQSIQ